jgi:isochorismate synthase
MIFFRFPFSEKIYTTDQISEEKPISFFSFNEYEMIDFKGEIKEVSINDFLKQNIATDLIHEELVDFNEENQNDYQKKLVEVIDFIKETQLSKLVISRRKLIDFKGTKINFTQTFLNLCKSYPNAFVYFFIKDGKSWMGAFSEILGKFDSENFQFETMSLAGTFLINENWTHKEIEEQKPVTNFIKNILGNYSEKVEQSKTYDHLSGNIKHLRTDFKAEIKAEQLENLIAELHPTPAVCGIPKEICKKAIEKFESHPRKLYSGYIKVQFENKIQYFVNLRCAEFFRNAALIYVGGGITAESSPEKEWQETELKADSILKNLDIFI